MAVIHSEIECLRFHLTNLVVPYVMKAILIIVVHITNSFSPWATFLVMGDIFIIMGDTFLVIGDTCFVIGDIFFATPNPAPGISRDPGH